jgi:hypothetical protein
MLLFRRSRLEILCGWDEEPIHDSATANGGELGPDDVVGRFDEAVGFKH